MKNILLSIRPKWCEKICHEIGKDEKGKPIYEKRIEVRKTAPKEVPFKVLIYCTKQRMTKVSCMYSYLHINEPKASLRYGERITTWGNIGDVIVNRTTPYEYVSYGMQGKVIGEFVCDRITDISVVVRNCNEDYNHVYHNDECKGSCLTWKELQEYGKGKPLYGWHISDLKIYDKPKELSEFYNLKGETIKRAYQSWGYINV